MELNTDHKGKITVISVKGEITAENVAELKKTLGDLLATGRIQLVFDMKDMPYIDSSGLAAIISRSNDLRKKKGDLYLAGMNETVKKIFDVTFLSQHFKIFPDAGEACRNFQ